MSVVLINIFILISLTACSTFHWTPDRQGSGPPSKKEADSSPGFVESHHPNEVELDHKFFIISYNPKHKLPNWVSYKIDLDQVSIKSGKRRDKFFADPQLISMKLAYATPKDFDTSTYDRGHMAPSEDFVWSQQANDETFVMSNMTPQKPALNRGSWKKLESKIRKWACKERQMTVVSGPFLSDDLPKFKSGVSIPKKFFKVVIDESAPRKSIAFVYTQEDGKKDMKAAATSVGAIERVTGFEFIITPDVIERDQLTKKFDLSQWKEGNCGPKKMVRN
jgi:endonuclease G